MYVVYTVSMLSCSCRLYVFQKIPSFRVLVGGGDGTVGWVLGGLDSMRDMLTFSSPPCATVPLGTGNTQLYTAECSIHILVVDV